MRPIAPALALLVALTTLPAMAQNEVVAVPGTDVGLPFSPGVLSGDFLFLSGALGNNPGTLEVPGDVTEQTHRTLDNLETVLKAAGMDLSRVVESNVFLADARHFREFATAYAERMKEPLPVRTTVEADIALPQALTEISMIAARPGVEIKRIVPEGWPESNGSFSWGLLAGDTLFIAGMVANDPATGQPTPGGIEVQTRRTMENIGAVLRAAGMGFEHVVSCRVFLPNARDYAGMNAVYPTFFKGPAPARATVRANLASPVYKIEVQCTAVQGEHRAVLPEGASPRPILSPAIQVGDRLFLSGMVGRNAEGQFPPDITEQTRLVLENLRATLKAANMDFGDVRDALVFLTDIRYYDAMNAVYREMMPSPPPARATVGTELMSPHAWVEIQMTAAAQPSAEEPTP